MILAKGGLRPRNSRACARIGMLAALAVMFMLFSGQNIAHAGDNYIATQFHAPGLRDSAGETLRMLVGSNIDAHSAHDEHKDDHHGDTAHHGEEGAQGADHSGPKTGNYAQVSCGSFCRTVSDDRINEKYEECLGPCFKCSQVAIREQASAHKPGNADIASRSFEQCWANIPSYGAFKMSN